MTVARNLSLDVVLGACIGSLFIANYLQVSLPIHYLGALALCVWLIYTADHLADASKIAHPAHSPRHHYHQRHFRTLSIAFLMVAGAGSILLFSLPLKLILWGLILSGSVGLYFVIIRCLPHTQNYYKELTASFLYAVGIFLAPLSMYPYELSSDIFLIFLQFVLLALANLIIFAWYETESDRADGHLSIVLLLGDQRAKQVAYACMLTTVGLGCLSLIFWPEQRELWMMQAIFLLMTLVLLLIITWPSFFQVEERYRIAGDAIFLFPLLTLLY